MNRLLKSCSYTRGNISNMKIITEQHVFLISIDTPERQQPSSKFWSWCTSPQRDGCCWGCFLCIITVAATVPSAAAAAAVAAGADGVQQASWTCFTVDYSRSVSSSSKDFSTSSSSISSASRRAWPDPPDGFSDFIIVDGERFKSSLCLTLVWSLWCLGHE